jgi:hypothetical protein
MGQIANGMAKRSGMYILKMQSRYDGSDRKWHEKKDQGTYTLKMQSRYNGSDHEWHDKEIRDIHPEDAEQV